MKLGIARETRALTRGCACNLRVDAEGYPLDDEGARYGAPRVGADAVTSASNTATDVIKVLGIGFLGFVALKYVFPTFIGAASETKRKKHEYSMIDRHERERREDRSDRIRRERAIEARDAQRGSYFGDGEAYDAEPIHVGHVPARELRSHHTLRSGERPW